MNKIKNIIAMRTEVKTQVFWGEHKHFFPKWGVEGWEKGSKISGITAWF